ncbi:ATP-binding protein [Nesterenkonia xinjiangensis]|uniref:histidine kinase n=1 Tax=Nesterenkonia xinjiangensis TaxID=225327 RepID=A0A7Z0GKE0_9MICC|nr:sensor histidine kinase [Nesterenkonia xinjiangensis]NYJ77348.1 two-component system CitB family sensor kinase [Nesterenkonia xinjiangensis]
MLAKLPEAETPPVGTRRRAPRREVSLGRRLFRWNMALLIGAVTVVSLLWGVVQYIEARQQYEERVLTMAESVAVMPTVREALQTEEPAEVLAPWAERLRAATGFEYIMIADRHGIRQSHPDPEAIGQRPSLDPAPVLAGETWTGVEHGHAGLTLRARVPILDEAEDVIGYVSVGTLASEVRLASMQTIPLILSVALVAVGAGAVGARLLARRLRADTHGLEPREITALLDGREALLHAIGEGVIGLDRERRVVLANTPARQLLRLPAAHLGRTPAQLGLSAEAEAVLSGPEAGEDLLLGVHGRILVCNRRPVRVREADGGVVVTLRDRTELTRLSDQLDGARTVTQGLRAQRHEFANRIHTVSGMLELGAVDEARDYLSELSLATSGADAEIAARIGDMTLAALVLAKSVQAAERGVRFSLSELSHLPEGQPEDLRDDVLLVVGNLVDNAMDAAGPEGWVELLVRRHGDVTDESAGKADEARETGETADGVVEVRVIDSGPGVDPDIAEDIFRVGRSTKGEGGRHGMGLALVHQACLRRGGSVTVENEDETTFCAYLPVRPQLVGTAAPDRPRPQREERP